MAVCTRCSHEAPEGSKFCPECGAPLGPDGGQAHEHEERKVITVVFADLVGFTARAERLDPEDVRALLGPYHQRLRLELERFGGTVEKFIGDAVVALFGAPATHEDDPERAVRAALAIRDWAIEQGERLQVRIAVNTGEALVALDARPSAGEGMASGDVVNTAARLQAAAPLNGVLVGEETYRATADVIDYRAADPVVAKGKTEPVRVWEAVEARSRLGVDVTQGVATEFVGRTRELDLLTSTLARVREELAPQLVTLVGVPGIGKSRIVFELFRIVDSEESFTTWRQGRSLPYGDGVTFWALAEIVKSEAGILESDPPSLAIEKLRSVIARLTRDPTEAQWLERHLRPLVGLTEDASAGPTEVFAAWRRFLEALAEERPVVLVCEDLHWADDQFLEFVDELVDRVVGVPLLVLATSRPELLQRRPTWGGGKSNALTISLPPLSDDDIARMVQGLPDQAVLEAGTAEALIGRAGGNPLYAEQYARVVQERGDLDELPGTVHGIIAARLDGLPEQEKHLLQNAAVIGKVFWVGSVQAIDESTRWEVEELLRALERKEFVQRSRTSSVGSESEWAFRHGLIRDVAYGQIPRAARAEKHQRTAVWIESLGRPEDQAEMLAHHYLLALELSDAAGLDTSRLGESAWQALRDAGERASGLYAIEAAEQFFGAALRLCPEGSPERARLLLRRAAPVRLQMRADNDLLTEARDALLTAGDAEGAAEAEVLLARSYWYHGQPELSIGHGDQALALTAEAPASRARVAALLNMATTTILGGDSARGLEVASQACVLAEQIGWDEGLSEALIWRSNAQLELGIDDGLKDFLRAIELARGAGALGTLSRLYNNLAAQHLTLGDLRSAVIAQAESVRIAEQVGAPEDLRWFQGVLIREKHQLGEWDEALRMSDAFIAEVEAGAPHYLAGQAYATRAEIRAARGDPQGALADAAKAYDVAEALQEPQAHHYLLPICAHVHLGAGDADGARELVEEMLALLRAGTELQFAVIALPTLAATVVRLGLTAELDGITASALVSPWTRVVDAYAAGDAAAAAAILQDIGVVSDEAEARLIAAEQLLAAGNRAEAETHARRAVELYEAAGASLYLERAQRLQSATT